MRVARALVHMLACLALAAPSVSWAANEGTQGFDGRWNVTLTCPPHNDDDDGAKGYVHRFPAEVRDGMLRGTHGTEGEPSFHLLTGNIAPDGSAALRLEGIINNPAYAVNNAQRGKPYSYRVRANFEGTSGTGQRVGKRKCDFSFRRA
ncbi:hypothetical protein [Variovorax sp. KK3]|uniref:hypothetical protein n=1 Tax=Variovorax sp. KK3 TaxID=1855728 RepID=UPI00117CF3FD|nr:hypothetical protein [Variovorax sp. KK3]